MSGYTKGKWEVKEFDAIRLDLGNKDNNCLLFGQNSETNAQLIAVAPDLLKMCKRVINDNCKCDIGYIISSTTFHKIEDIVAKAEKN